MKSTVGALIDFLLAHNGINDKAKLTKLTIEKFNLVKDRSVFYKSDLAVRFSLSANANFSNTVLSLSRLQKFDDRPFIVCVITPDRNYIHLSNSTFLKKISHSSEKFRENNIRGSFNGSDIMRSFENIENHPKNIESLFNIHTEIGFEGNLARLVEATNNISPTGTKFLPTDEQRMLVLTSPDRAEKFIHSRDAIELKAELDSKVENFKEHIVLAALIENVNVRGRIIEYLIAGENEKLKREIIKELKQPNEGIPQFKTENTLGDYSRNFNDFKTETDVKTKIIILNSNPKAYNLDKMLEFLATERSVLMFYFVGIDSTKITNTVLISIFQSDLLNSTILLRHWAGRNSRGVSQFHGKAINKLLESSKPYIDKIRAINFLQEVLAL